MTIKKTDQCFVWMRRGGALLRPSPTIPLRKEVEYFAVNEPTIEVTITIAAIVVQIGRAHV